MRAPAVLLAVLLAAPAMAQTPTPTPLRISYFFDDLSAKSGIGRLDQISATAWALRGPYSYPNQGYLFGRTGLYGSNPAAAVIPSDPQLESWDAYGDVTPSCVKIANVVYCYFSGFNSSFMARLGLRISQDGGMTFTKWVASNSSCTAAQEPFYCCTGSGAGTCNLHANPLLPMGIDYPVVKFDEHDANANFRWKMWAFCASPVSLCYATSPDGISWTSPGLLPLVGGGTIATSGGYAEPSVVYSEAEQRWYVWNQAVLPTVWTADVASGPYTAHASGLPIPAESVKQATITSGSGTTVNVTGGTVFSINDMVQVGNGSVYPMTTQICGGAGGCGSAITGSALSFRDPIPAGMTQVHGICFGTQVLASAYPDGAVWRALFSCGPGISYSGIVGGCHPEMAAVGYAGSLLGPWTIDYSNGIPVEPVPGSWTNCFTGRVARVLDVYRQPTPATPIATATASPTPSPTPCNTAAPFSCTGVCP